jgi:lipopolysaccharide export system protein LptC
VKRKSSKLKSVKARAWEFAAQLLEWHARADRGGVTPDLSFLPELEHIRVAVVPALKRRAEIVERNQSKRKSQ